MSKAGDQDILSVSCPFCSSLDAGRYHRHFSRFVCTNRRCTRLGEIVDYTAFEAEVENQRKRFLDNLPSLAPGDSRQQVAEIAKELFHRGIDPRLVLQLVTAWAEAFPVPPLSSEQAVRTVDTVAGRILEGTVR